MSSQHWIPLFLSTLAASGNVSKSARTAGITSGTAYSLRKTDADFAAAWEVAEEDFADILDEEAIRRAVVGVQKPVVYQGQLTPIWELDADGRPLLEVYEVPGTDGTMQVHTRPIQKRDANGYPVWLTITEYSDVLLALQLKGRRKRFATERTELTGADGGDVKVVDSTARAARVAYLMGLAAKRKADEDKLSEFA